MLIASEPRPTSPFPLPHTHRLLKEALRKPPTKLFSYQTTRRRINCSHEAHKQDICASDEGGDIAGCFSQSFLCVIWEASTVWLHWAWADGYVFLIVVCPRQLRITSNANEDLGYNMAKNLQAKLSSSDTLRVYDINPESTERFVQEVKSSSSGAAVEGAATVREAAEDSVSHIAKALSSCFLL